ncbi:MAG: sulfotransferase [Candidatus Promineifilaceae bacterium]|nr:sulfotransferase [Candidatus Promineifilaceae bacterium]
MKIRRLTRYLNVQDVKKFLHYLFGAESFRPRFDLPEPAPALLETARQIRGPERGPAVMIHGILPRAGTVYTGQLLRLHPKLHAFPHNLYEVPFLQLSDEVLRLQERFLASHRHNRGKVGETDFLTLFGSALVAHLHAGTPAGKRMLVKVPSVEYLHFFPHVYPHEHLLVLVRDGRDLVDSTVRTWPMFPFSFACRRWRRAAGMVVRFHGQWAGRREGYWLARYEDAVENPEAFVREACRRFGLDESAYPYDEIEKIRIRGSSTVTAGGDVVWDPQQRPEDFRPVGRWRQWPARKKRTFKRLAGEMLLALGYCEDLSW